LAVPAFVAFLPMHTFITSSVNNDSLAELLASLVILSLFRILKGGLSWQRVMNVACLLASGLLTKRTTTFTIPLVALTIIPLYYLRAKSPKLPPADKTPHTSSRWLRQWYIWLLIISAIGLGLWALTLNLQFAIRYSLFALLTFASFWANFGWLNVPLDLGWYAALAVFSLLALCGLGLFAVRVARGIETLEPWQRRALLMLLLAVLLIFAQTASMMIVPSYIPQQGRYLFPALIPLAVFFTLGLREWVPAPRRGLFPLTLVLGMFVLDSVSLCCYIIPHFYG